MINAGLRFVGKNRSVPSKPATFFQSNSLIENATSLTQASQIISEDAKKIVSNPQRKCEIMSEHLFQIIMWTNLAKSHDQYWIFSLYDFFMGARVKLGNFTEEKLKPIRSYLDALIDRAIDNFNVPQRLDGFTLNDMIRSPSMNFVFNDKNNIFGIPTAWINQYETVLELCTEIRTDCNIPSSVKLLDLAITKDLKEYELPDSKQASGYLLFVLSFLFRNVYFDKIHGNDFKKGSSPILCYHNLTSIFTLLLAPDNVAEGIVNQNTFLPMAYDPNNPQSENKIRFVDNDGLINIFREVQDSKAKERQAASSSNPYKGGGDYKRYDLPLENYMYDPVNLFYNRGDSYLRKITDHIGVSNVVFDKAQVAFYAKTESKPLPHEPVIPEEKTVTSNNVEMDLFMHNVRVGYNVNPEARLLKYSLNRDQPKNYIVFGSSGSGKTTFIGQLISSLCLYRKYFVNTISYSNPDKKLPQIAIENLESSRTNTVINLKRIRCLETFDNDNKIYLFKSSISNHLYAATPYVKKELTAGDVYQFTSYQNPSKFVPLLAEAIKNNTLAVKVNTSKYFRPIDISKQTNFPDLFKLLKDEMNQDWKTVTREPPSSLRMRTLELEFNNEDIMIYDTMGNEDYYFVTGLKTFTTDTQQTSTSQISKPKEIDMVIRCESYDLLVKSLLSHHWAKESPDKDKFHTYEASMVSINNIFPANDLDIKFTKSPPRNRLSSIHGGKEMDGPTPISLVEKCSLESLTLIPLYSIPVGGGYTEVYNLPLYTSPSSIYIQFLLKMKNIYRNSSAPLKTQIQNICDKTTNVFYKNFTADGKQTSVRKEGDKIDKLNERTQENITNFASILNIYKNNKDATIVPLTAKATQFRDKRFINLIFNISKLDNNQLVNLEKLLSVINYNSYTLTALLNTISEESRVGA
jgi:hypothetical protein